MNQNSYHHGNLEEELILAGLEVMKTEGINGCSLRKVSAYCGVSHMAPYKHYKDKEALLVAMQQHISKQFARVLNDVLVLHQNQPKVMIYLAHAYLRFFHQNPHYLNLLLLEDKGIIELSQILQPSNYEPFEIFRKAGLRFLRSKGVSEDQLHVALISMWSNVYGITMMSIMKGVRYDAEWEELLVEVLSQQRY